MATGSGILHTYQQPKFGGGVPLIMSRRTLRIREKYILFLVGFVFSCVCFGAIFFLPDMRERVSTNGHIGPVEIDILFLPQPDKPGIGLGLRHGQNEGRDPHDEHDEMKLRDLIMKATPADRRVDTDRTSGHSSVETLAYLHTNVKEVEGNVMVEKPQEDHSKVLPPVDDLDNTMNARQEKIKEVIIGLQDFHIKLVI